jgi:hypothetical protein
MVRVMMYGIIESPCLGKCMHSDSIPAYDGGLRWYGSGMVELYDGDMNIVTACARRHSIDAIG